MKIAHILSVFILIIIGLYGSFSFFTTFSLLIYYCLGLCMLKLLIRPADDNVLNIYGLFYGIYGVLAVLSQIELIHDPFTDYFIHNDACDSFFSQVVSQRSELRWDNLVEGTLLNPRFSDYPLPMFVFAILSKITNGLDLYNLRFFLRIHIFMMSAIIPALLADLQFRHDILNRKVIKRTIIFGIVSYLYITSTVFTRDIYVCFFYTWIFYEILHPKQTKMPLKFIVLFLLCFGSRPENGLFSLVFIFSYYIYNKRDKVNPSVLVVGLLMVGFVFNYLHDALFEAVDTVSRYQTANLHNNSGGLWGKVNALPFPLNYLGMGSYLILMPLPFDMYILGKGNSFLTMPYILSPYLMALIFGVTLWYVFNNHKKNKKYALFIIVAIISFLFISQASPDIRRSFAVIPGLYMLYCLIADGVPAGVTRNIKRLSWPLILIVGIVIYVYVNI